MAIDPIYPPETPVVWRSHARGRVTEKQGIIVGYVGPGADATALIPSDAGAHYLKLRETTSRNPRYVVRVERDGSTWWYAPRASVVMPYSV